MHTVIMNTKVTQKVSSQVGGRKSGFALISTILVMSLLMLIAVATLNLSSVEVSNSSVNKAQAAAEANARMALMLAIGQLQETAGSDQRVTAVADIFDDAGSGRRYWTGVWDTTDYDPSSPDDKEFITWLVPSGGNAVDVSEVDERTNDSVADDHTIFEGLGDNESVIVPKVMISDGGDTQNFYSYWVEDEGIKASLGWNEGNTGDDVRDKQMRLASAPGVDYGVFEGPFDTVSYPLELGGANSWLENTHKTMSFATTPLTAEASSAETVWLQRNRHHMTVQSLGVMSDTKLGGLRRDLSLAFEMDGDAEAENATLFNQQDGVFVGGNDRLAADHSFPNNVIPNGMPTPERFLWRDTSGSGTDFSSGIGSGRVMRGPNWWAIRDYANLYKRLKGSRGNYTIAARPYFPNRSSEVLALSDYLNILNEGANIYDREHLDPNTSAGETTSIGTNPNNSNDYYLYRPARPNYVPVNLGTSILLSVLAKNQTGTKANLAVGIDPFFYFWNPYNRKIEFDNIAITLGAGFSGSVKIWINEGTPDEKIHQLGLSQILKDSLANKVGKKIIFLIKGPIVLEPGEVVVATPTSTDGEMVLGYEGFSDTSGLILENINSVTPIEVDLSDTVGVNFIKGDSSIERLNATRHEVDISFPAAGVSIGDITGDLTQLGEHAQNVWVSEWAGTNSMARHVNAAANATGEPVVSELVSDMIDVKVPFGGKSLLIKPASAGGEVANPYEMFSRFNPVASIIKREIWAPCSYTQLSRHIAANSEFAIRNEMGIDFSGLDRGGFWGLSYQNTGSNFVPLADIPSRPLISLAEFSNANLSIVSSDPYKAVGNSWSSAIIEPSSVYGGNPGYPGSWGDVTSQDYSWLINDTLFDRYYLSGIAPAFSINSVGYSESASLKDTLTAFFNASSTAGHEVLANPALMAYLPSGVDSVDAVNALSAEDGYQKMGAYSLIRGAFNINSTSPLAWEAFLRSNMGLEVDYADSSSSSDGSNTTPFPNGASPSTPGNGSSGPADQWAGLPRLTESQITSLASNIVEQVRLRGPFMSISDFVNHSIDRSIDVDTSYTGALQAAIDKSAKEGSGINEDSIAAAVNAAAVDANAMSGTPVYPSGKFNANTPVVKSTTGIPGDLTQAQLLMPIAPRISARSDTFKVRAYGEVRSSDGTKILATATCEAIIQRLPEYTDSTSDPGNNEPWDEASDSVVTEGSSSSATSNLNAMNQKFGRKFKVVTFRWLSSQEL